MTHRSVWSLCVAVLLGSCASAGAQTRIELRARGTWDPAAPLLVRDVAEVSGADAERLGGVVVRTSTSAPIAGDLSDGTSGGARAVSRAACVERVDTAAVRAVLDAAGVNWAKVELSGGTCSVDVARGGAIGSGGRPGAPPAGVGAGEAVPVDFAVGARAAALGGKVDGRDAGPVKAGFGSGGDSEPRVRDAVLERLAEMLGVGLDEMRVRFVSGDLEILDERVGAASTREGNRGNEGAAGSGGGSGEGRGIREGERVVVEPRASAASGRFPIQITVYDVAAERVSRSGRVIADVSVIREVVVVSRRIGREEQFDADRLVLERRWEGTGEAAPASWERVVRSAARSALTAGHVVRESDLLAPVAVERGDIVRVHCLSGSVRVEAVARALESGREGERVRLQLEGSKKSFKARLSGKGEAVMVIESGAAEDDDAPAAENVR